ncbi:MAG: mobile mystery protein B [Steroidobacteraceae bacterium]
MNVRNPDSATPVDPDEARALIPSHIATQAELNEWEHDNIVEGERWAFARRRKNILTAEFLQQLHRRMFGATWRWAGGWRTTEKNIGVAPERIPEAVRQLLLDVAAQLEAHSYPLRGIAARLHHRLVQIHPFPNGNGRVARTYADLLLFTQGEERFHWGAGDLVAPGDVRERYIAALRAADGHDYDPLLNFLEVR